MVEFLPSQRKGNWRLYFDWVPREAVFSLCLPPWGWNDLAGMLVSAKNRNLTGWRGWKSTFSHFLGETCTCPADNWYHSAVVCQASLRVEIPGILLFCGIVQLFPCLRREQQTLPGVQSFMSHSGTSSSQISWATAFFTKKYLVQAAFEAGNYLKQILSEESSLCPVEASSGCIPPQQDLSFPPRGLANSSFWPLLSTGFHHTWFEFLSVELTSSWGERGGVRVPPELFGAEMHWEGREEDGFSLFCCSAKHKGLCAPQSFLLHCYFALKHPKCRTGLAGQNYGKNLIWKQITKG